jgi:hypothetical protein
MKLVRSKFDLRINKINVCLILGIIASAIIPFLSSHSFNLTYLGADGVFHLNRILIIADNIKHGEPFLRMAPNFYYDYGFPVRIFYPDFFLYPFGVLVALGMNAAIVFNLLLVLINVLRFVISYGMGNLFFETKRRSMIFALLFSFNPYSIFNSSVRSAVGEAIAYIFIPVIFVAFYRMLHNKGKYNYILLTIGMSGVVLSHVLTIVLTIYALGIYSLFHIKKFENVYFWKNISIPIGLTLVLTMTQYLPILEQYLHNKVIGVQNGFDMREITKLSEVSLKTFFQSLVMPFGWRYEIIPTTGILFLVLLGLSLLIGKKKIERIDRGSLVSFLIFFIIIMFSNKFGNLLSYLPGMNEVQFLFRFWGWGVLFASIVIAQLLPEQIKKYYQLLIIGYGLFGMFTAFVQAPHFDPDGSSEVKMTISGEMGNYENNFKKNVGSYNYSPIQQKEKLSNRKIIEGKSGDVKLKDFISGPGKITSVNKKKFNNYEIQLINAKNSTVNIAKNYYYGYTLETTGNLVVSEVRVNQTTGQIEFSATGSGTVHIIYKNTFIQKLSGVVSFVGFVLFAIYLIALKKKKKD